MKKNCIKVRDYLCSQTFLLLNKYTPVMGFPGSLVVKNTLAYSGDTSSVPESGRYPGVGHDNPLQYPCLEKSHGQRSLAGYSPWSCKELDKT